MCKICPKCGAIAEFNAYYGRDMCTSCSWEGQKTNNCKEVLKKKTTLVKDPVSHNDLIKA